MLSVKCPWPLLLKYAPRQTIHMQHNWGSAESQSSSRLAFLLPFLGHNDHLLFLFLFHPPIIAECSCRLWSICIISIIAPCGPKHGCLPHSSLIPLISCINRSQPDLFQVHSGTVHSMGFDHEALRTYEHPGVSPGYCHPQLSSLCVPSSLLTTSVTCLATGLLHLQGGGKRYYSRSCSFRLSADISP